MAEILNHFVQKINGISIDVRTSAVTPYTPVLSLPCPTSTSSSCVAWRIGRRTTGKRSSGWCIPDTRNLFAVFRKGKTRAFDADGGCGRGGQGGRGRGHGRFESERRGGAKKEKDSVACWRCKATEQATEQYRRRLHSQTLREMRCWRTRE